MNLVLIIIAAVLVYCFESPFYTSNGSKLAIFEKTNSLFRVILGKVLLLIFITSVILGIYLGLLAFSSEVFKNSDLNDHKIGISDIKFLVWLLGITLFFYSKSFIREYNKGHIRPKPRWITANEVVFFVSTTIISISVLLSIRDDVEIIKLIFSDQKNKTFKDGIETILFIVGSIPMMISVYCFFWHSKYFKRYNDEDYSGKTSVLLLAWGALISVSAWFGLIRSILGFFLF